jgi:hypothetical protein
MWLDNGKLRASMGFHPSLGGFVANVAGEGSLQHSIWHFAVISLSANRSLDLFLDGRAVDSTPVAGGLRPPGAATSSLPVCIGGTRFYCDSGPDKFGKEELRGLMDELIVYADALTPDQVAFMYNVTMQGDCGDGWVQTVRNEQCDGGGHDSSGCDLQCKRPATSNPTYSPSFASSLPPSLLSSAPGVFHEHRSVALASCILPLSAIFFLSAS